jgi:hypothetical protein
MTSPREKRQRLFKQLLSMQSGMIAAPAAQKAVMGRIDPEALSAAAEVLGRRAAETAG